MTHLLRISCCIQELHFFDVKKTLFYERNKKSGSIQYFDAHGHTQNPFKLSAHDWNRCKANTAIINVLKIDKILLPYKKISDAPGWSGVGTILIVTALCCVTICPVWVAPQPLGPDYSCNKIIYISHIGAVFILLLACIKLFSVQHQSTVLHNMETIQQLLEHRLQLHATTANMINTPAKILIFSRC